MKASLLAISISSVLAAPAFASAPQVDVELANQQTLQLIDGQMNAIDASVQYKLNEQYTNATPGTTATIDDVTYEKQSNGTWAAVGAASAALVAGLLNSSSSSQDSQSPTLPIEAIPDNEIPTSPTPSHPIAHTPTNPIDKDRPVVDKPVENEKDIIQITDPNLERNDAVLMVNGEAVGTVEYKDDQITVFTKDGFHTYDVKVIDSENNDGKLVRIAGDTNADRQWVHINSEGVVTPIDAEKAKSRLQSIDRSKLQSIDPTKLQKAKSAIQQRLRG